MGHISKWQVIDNLLEEAAVWVVQPDAATSTDFERRTASLKCARCASESECGQEGGGTKAVLLSGAKTCLIQCSASLISRRLR